MTRKLVTTWSLSNSSTIHGKEETESSGVMKTGSDGAEVTCCDRLLSYLLRAEDNMTLSTLLHKKRVCRMVYLVEASLGHLAEVHDQ